MSWITCVILQVGVQSLQRLKVAPVIDQIARRRKGVTLALEEDIAVQFLRPYRGIGRWVSGYVGPIRPAITVLIAPVNRIRLPAPWRLRAKVFISKDITDVMKHNIEDHIHTTSMGLVNQLA